MEFRDLRGLSPGQTGIASAVAYSITEANPGVHLGIPSPTVTVVIDLRDGLDLAGPGLTGLTRFRTCIGGLHSRPYRIHHDGTQVGVQLALTPAGVRRVFGMPVAELADTAVEFDVVDSSRADRVADAVRAAPRELRALVASRELLAGCEPDDDRCRAQPDAEAAWRHIIATGGRCTVSEMTARSGWSARYLTSKFTAEYGMGPKQAARLVRFDRALTALRAGARIEAVAARGGYADQAHLTREFSDFVSMPPARYLALDEFA